MGLSDIMLAGGCALHIEAIHGELVSILSGLDSGLSFMAVRENSQDIVLNDSGSLDPRAKRIIRFRDGNVPRLNAQDIVKTEDGKRWHAVKNPQAGYLTNDFELVEIIAKDA